MVSSDSGIAHLPDESILNPTNARQPCGDTEKIRPLVCYDFAGQMRVRPGMAASMPAPTAA